MKLNIDYYLKFCTVCYHFKPKVPKNCYFNSKRIIGWLFLNSNNGKTNINLNIWIFVWALITTPTGMEDNATTDKDINTSTVTENVTSTTDSVMSTPSRVGDIVTSGRQDYITLTEVGDNNVTSEAKDGVINMDTDDDSATNTSMGANVTTIQVRDNVTTTGIVGWRTK